MLSKSFAPEHAINYAMFFSFQNKLAVEAMGLNSYGYRFVSLPFGNITLLTQYQKKSKSLNFI